MINIVSELCERGKSISDHYQNILSINSVGYILLNGFM